ncbi:MAG: PEP/pyruvate-binding domain-containing protein [Firmicutes bacterium]|nr:PEP/pyruvate-binding domain-containing protein [Bacillota bacterium]
MYTVGLVAGTPSSRTLGSKAASLATLTNLDMRIPSGFVITTAAQRQYLAFNQIDLRDSDAGEQIRTGRFPDDLWDEISAAYDAHIYPRPAAVRSSATLEDLADASFAGQYETVLDVHRDALLDAIKTCWASQCGPHVTRYLQNHGLQPEECLMAVIVQQMVNADAAGVCFSINPVTGANEIVINANWGLGDSVVSALVMPDMFVVAKDTREVLQQVLGDKEWITKPRPDGGIEQVATDASSRNKFCLTPSEAQEVADVACRIERHLGMPVDLEFAYQDHLLFILQGRPITGRRV